MSKVIFIQSDGKEQVVPATPGQSLMQIALSGMVNGIVASCGGSCSCATCHAYIDPNWVDKIQPASEFELTMLDGALDVLPSSRLTCQVQFTQELDGIVVRVPENQS